VRFCWSGRGWGEMAATTRLTTAIHTLMCQ